MKIQTHHDSFCSELCRLGLCSPHSHRGVLYSQAQLLANNSSFCVPLFLPVSVVVSLKKGSGCHFASRLFAGGSGGAIKTCFEKM